VAVSELAAVTSWPGCVHRMGEELWRTVNGLDSRPAAQLWVPYTTFADLETVKLIGVKDPQRLTRAVATVATQLDGASLLRAQAPPLSRLAPRGSYGGSHGVSG
jgi:hypothetical protein